LIIRSKRLKTSEVIVDEKGVVLRVPLGKPESQIQELLHKKANWIFQKKQRYETLTRNIKKSSFIIGSTLPYLGKEYPIVKSNQNGNEHIQLRGGKFFISTNDLSRSNISSMYQKWLKQKSEKIFGHKVVEYSEKLKVKPHKIIVKNLKNRWGSVTRQGILNLNVNLLKAPNEIINYVIIHELCHLIFKQHSHHFWNLLKKVMPGYKESIIWLESNASSLIE
jgi:predicted metal-dependent hydrolase